MAFIETQRPFDPTAPGVGLAAEFTVGDNTTPVQGVQIGLFEEKFVAGLPQWQIEIMRQKGKTPTESIIVFCVDTLAPSDQEV